jgi:hypothetical protein
MLNRYPGRSAALDYLLQDIDSTDKEIIASVRALLAQLLDGKELNDSSRRLVDGASQALECDPEVLADALGYSSDDNASWHLVLRHAAELSPKLLNQLARQDINRRAKLAAIEAGLAAGKLSDSTLTSLLLLGDDQQIADLLLESVADDTNRALQFLTLMRSSEKPLKPAETEARLMAIAVPPETLKHLQATSEYSILPWEALTYSTPDEYVDQAREILRTDAAELRAELAPKISEDHKKLVDFLASDQRRAAAVLLSYRTPQTDDDIDLLLAWFAQEAASGYLGSPTWRVLTRIANDATIGKITDAIRPHIEVLGFRTSLEHLHGPLGRAVAAVFLEAGADNTLRAQAHHWQVQQPERTDAELREALYAEDATVRITAAQLLVHRLDRAELIQLQDDYPNVDGPYWYNVVAFFDEHLYAPTPSD